MVGSRKYVEETSGPNRDERWKAYLDDDVGWLLGAVNKWFTCAEIDPAVCKEPGVGELALDKFIFDLIDLREGSGMTRRQFAQANLVTSLFKTNCQTSSIFLWANK